METSPRPRQEPGTALNWIACIGPPGGGPGGEVLELATAGHVRQVDTVDTPRRRSEAAACCDASPRVSTWPDCWPPSDPNKERGHGRHARNTFGLSCHVRLVRLVINLGMVCSLEQLVHAPTFCTSFGVVHGAVGLVLVQARQRPPRREGDEEEVDDEAFSTRESR